MSIKFFIYLLTELSIILFILNKTIADSVLDTRQKFLGYVGQNRQLFDPIDIDRVKSHIDIIETYLEKNNGNVEQSIKAMIDTMKWRKQMDINHLNASYFPKEVYKTGVVIEYGRDLKGARVVIVRARVYKGLSAEWSLLAKKFVAYHVERVSKNDFRNGNKGMCFVFDLNGFNVGNVDTNMTRSILVMLRDYYPMLDKTVLLHDLFAPVHYIAKLALGLITESKVLHVIKGEEIYEFIAKDQLPDFMGGTNPAPYRKPPEEAKYNLYHVAKVIGSNNEQADRIVKHLKKYYKS